MATALRAGLLLALVLSAIGATPVRGDDARIIAGGESFGGERPYLPGLGSQTGPSRGVIYNPHVRLTAGQIPDATSGGGNSAEVIDLFEDSPSDSVPAQDGATATDSPMLERSPRASAGGARAPSFQDRSASPAPAEEEAGEFPYPQTDESLNEPFVEQAPLTTQPTGNWDDVPMGPEMPAPVCSSRNLLQPGCYYASADFVYMTRSSPKADRIIARDFSLPLGANLLESDRGLGWSPGTRLTIGKFLGRDAKCRDYNAEFTFFGLFDWNDEKGINAFNPAANNLIFTVLDPSNNIQGFSDAAAQQYVYNSQFDSFEANLRISGRLTRDRMELQPNGQWVRRCDPDLLHAFLIGARAAHIDERFGYFSQGVNPATMNGTYVVNTSNELYGFQGGVELMYQQCKWHIGGRFKSGLYVNFAEQDTVVQIIDTPATAPDPADRHEFATEDLVSWMGEFQLEGAYNVTPNVALRAGYNMTMVSSTALAIDQVTFSPETPANINVGGFMFMQGLSMGVEVFW